LQVTYRPLEGARARHGSWAAETWAGKFTDLDLALSLLGAGGIYVVDLLPQPSWPEGHAARVPGLIADLESRSGFVATKLAWATGLMLLVRAGARGIDGRPTMGCQNPSVRASSRNRATPRRFTSS
jgi:hypothetical protein